MMKQIGGSSFLSAKLVLLVAALYFSSTCTASTSPSGCVMFRNWPDQPPPTGTWSYVADVSPMCIDKGFAGSRGWFQNASQVPLTQENGEYLRIKQIFLNMQTELSHYDATLEDLTLIDVRVHNLTRHRPIVNAVELEIFGVQTDYLADPKYPPRAILGSYTFNGLDCYDPDTNAYYKGTAGPNGQVICTAGDDAVGDICEIIFRAAIRKSIVNEISRANHQ